MTERRKAETIRQRMAEVRRDLAENAGDLSIQTQRLTDWRFYLRNYPWVFTGAAMAVGFLIVPRRSAKPERLNSEDLRGLAELLDQNEVIVEKRPRAGILHGLIASAFSLAGGWLLKYAMGRVGQRVIRPRREAGPGRGRTF